MTTAAEIDRRARLARLKLARRVTAHLRHTQEPVGPTPGLAAWCAANERVAASPLPTAAREALRMLRRYAPDSVVLQRWGS